MVGVLLSVSGANTLTGGFPACDSAVTEEALKNAVEQNATSNVATLKYLGIKDIQELSFDDNKSKRHCRAAALFNSGSKAIRYRLFANGDDLLVELTPDYLPTPSRDYRCRAVVLPSKSFGVSVS